MRIGDASFREAGLLVVDPSLARGKLPRLFPWVGETISPDSVFSRASGTDWEKDMSDDKNERAPQDASRIAMGEDYEVRYWTNKFGVSRDRLQQAIDAVGNLKG
jgi:hypothetical protein